MTRASDTAKLLGAGATILDGTTISTADNTAQLTLTSTDADSNFGPLLTMYRNSSSPADADFLGDIEFQGENSAGETITYAQVFGRTVDVTDGTEDGRIAIKTIRAGASRSALDISATEIVLNDDSEDVDFRVESNGQANMLFVDGGNDAVLFATTTNGTTAVGTVVRAAGEVLITRSGGNPLLLNRTSSEGTTAEFRYDNTYVAGIAITNGGNILSINGLGSGLGFHKSASTNIIYPFKNNTTSDNVIDLGSSGVRFDDIFATNGTIQTSDRNEKQDIEELSDAEKRVAVVAKGLMRKFRWKSAVAEKGDDARTHFGIIAQDLQDAFTAESLDAGDYAMFISSTWWEKEISVDAVEADEANDIEAKDAYTYIDTKDEATDGYTEKTRLGVRYSELLAFIISAI